MPGGELYNASQLIGKTLVAQVDVPVFNALPDRGGKQIGIIKAGSPVGWVYSWVLAKDSTVWWQYKDAKGQIYYTLQGVGLYSVSALREQGVLSVPEQIEVAKQKDKDLNAQWYENKAIPPLGGAVAAGLKTLMWVGIGGFAVVMFLKSRK
jgi:hypothetical protein